MKNGERSWVSSERQLWELFRPDQPKMPGDTPFDVAAFASLRRAVLRRPVILAAPLAAAVTWVLLAGLVPQ